MNRRRFLGGIIAATYALVTGVKEFLSLSKQHEAGVREVVSQADEVLIDIHFDEPISAYTAFIDDPLGDEVGYYMGVSRGLDSASEVDRTTIITTIDGGVSWTEMEMPDMPEDDYIVDLWLDGPEVEEIIVLTAQQRKYTSKDFGETFEQVS